MPALVNYLKTDDTSGNLVSTRQNYSGFPTRSDTNWSVQSKKRARSLEFRIEEEESLYICLAKTKVLNSCAITAHLLLHYAICWFLVTQFNSS